MTEHSMTFDFEEAKVTEHSCLYLLNPKTGELYMKNATTLDIPKMNAPVFTPEAIYGIREKITHHLFSQIQVVKPFVLVVAAALRLSPDDIVFRRLHGDPHNVMRVGVETEEVMVTPQGFSNFRTLAVIQLPHYIAVDPAGFTDEFAKSFFTHKEGGSS